MTSTVRAVTIRRLDGYERLRARALGGEARLHPVFGRRGKGVTPAGGVRA